MSFQVCTRDEYGQTANVFNAKFNVIEDAIKSAKDAVTSDNINNAFTLDEKRRNWSSCFVELFDNDGNPDPNVVYAGKGIAAREMVCIIKKGAVESVVLSQTDALVKIFIGEVQQSGKVETWYAQDQRGKDITTVDHPDLMSKTVYYIRQAP